MIPEIEVTCRGERLFINSVTVEQYKKYISLMEKNDTEKFSGVMFFNKKIMQEMFGNELSLAAVGEIDAVKMSKKINVVVLSPSLKNASAWEDLGGFIIKSSNMQVGIKKIKSSLNGLYVLLNKYDGIIN